MNLRLVFYYLGIICILIGAAMAFSLPWAFPAFGHRHDIEVTASFEANGFYSLLASWAICWILGFGLMHWGKNASGRLYRKEAMAVVGLSWVMATILGGLPYWLSNTYRGPSVRLFDPGEPAQVYAFRGVRISHWINMEPLDESTFRIVQALLASGADGLTEAELADVDANFDSILLELRQDERWRPTIMLPDAAADKEATNGVYRIRWVRTTFVDALFESQSGFSTTGATVISDLEDPRHIAHCILFWRSSTHFLGGLGIIVLFVVVLGQGSAGKAMMRAEMPGPSKEGSQSRMQHTAWNFAAVYCGLNLLLTVLLWLCGLTWFDALCHAFGTMATGGFSTYNGSLGHFQSSTIDYIVAFFMILAGSNFTLLYLSLIGRPKLLLLDLEWKTYMIIIGIASLLVVVYGMYYDNFLDDAPSEGFWSELANAIRFGFFTVVSIITTTGYGTHDFDNWNHMGRGILLLLMFVGGCSGSTGGGLKVIRHVLFVKILRLEVEQSFHPTVVRPLRVNGQVVADPELRQSILVYFSFVLIIFITSWVLVVMFEPDDTWGTDAQHKLLDGASAVAATLNNIGPGLGTVGATQNYGHFSWATKLLFTWLMMLGRVEIFAILVLFVPQFWKSR
ncbi:MAG: TrkH family potassium uptake protein [Pirellulaceae bacterium]